MSVDPEALRRQAFPVLDAEQIAVLCRFGRVKETMPGDILFDVGQAGYPLVVVLEGRTRILDRSDHDRVVKESGPGEFHGELGMLTRQKAMAACVVVAGGRVLLLEPAAVREVIRTVPELSDLLVLALAARREILMDSLAATLSIVGPERSSRVLALQEFLDRNLIPHRWLDPRDPTVPSLIAPFGYPPPAATLVVVAARKLLADPTPLELAQALGLDLALDATEPADMIVVGTGPAGLAAAVYGASEGLATIAIDDVAIGGQAGTSSRIENYLGFPSGISGGELAFRGAVQAIKFGARVTVPRQAVSLAPHDGVYAVGLDDGGEVFGRAIVIATGARYRRLGLPRQEAFEGAGIYYAATDLEARFCGGNEVVVVGGGNSAGQAAMFLSRHARRVHLVYRGPDLAAAMSDYLIVRLERAPNVTIHLGTNVTALRGQKKLEGVTLTDAVGATTEIAAPAVFAMIGVEPCTTWLTGTLALDPKGFVQTGPAVGGGSPYETSLPGVFAVGDVRAASVKRVASAVGEGSVVVQAVHRHLEAMRAGPAATVGADGRAAPPVNAPLDPPPA